MPIAARCKRHKTFHSVSVLITGGFAGSTLFAVIADIAPIYMQWVGAFCAFYAASCSGINSLCKFPERESDHKGAIKRLKSFATSCKAQVAKYKSGNLDDKQLEALLDQHVIDYNSVTNDIPHV